MMSKSPPVTVFNILSIFHFYINLVYFILYMYTYVCGITVYKCNKYQLWYAPFPNFHAKAFQKNRKSQVSIHKDFAIARAALIASTLLDVL